jgi:hypothetical protein
MFAEPRDHAELQHPADFLRYLIAAVALAQFALDRTYSHLQRPFADRPDP